MNEDKFNAHCDACYYTGSCNGFKSDVKQTRFTSRVKKSEKIIDKDTLEIVLSNHLEDGAIKVILKELGFK